MDITLQQLASYGAWFIFALGALAFITALIVQAVKEWPPFRNAPTSLVAMVVALVLTLGVFFAATSYLGIAIVWYMIFAAIVAGFLVWYISTNGWDKFHELWNRYKKDIPTK